MKEECFLRQFVGIGAFFSKRVGIHVFFGAKESVLESAKDCVLHAEGKGVLHAEDKLGGGFDAGLNAFLECAGRRGAVLFPAFEFQVPHEVAPQICGEGWGLGMDIHEGHEEQAEKRLTYASQFDLHKIVPLMDLPLKVCGG